MAGRGHNPLPRFPSEPVESVTGPLGRFLRIEAASGVVLLCATAVALLAANSPFADAYLAFWKTQVGFTIGTFEVSHKLQHWVNDGLMAIFFFVVGLEVKRELVLGELRDPRRAALPVAAAIGGMVVPALIYLVFQWGEPGQNGWGIPMATDIAFVVGCMAVLGSRVPKSMRVMLLSLAIVDDIGAILVIAIGYTEALRFDWLCLGLAGILATIGLGRVGVRNIAIYFVVGVVVWFGFHESGVHATISGVILGLITPARRWIPDSLLGDMVEKAREVMRGDAAFDGTDRYAVLRHVERGSREALSPLERIETLLHPWVGFVIMPIFALANAGVAIQLDAVTSGVAIAVMAGLFLGKPIGVVVFSWVAVRLGLAALPAGVNWGMVVGGGFLAGIGFTMALFIAGLALGPAELDNAKIGILVASAVAGVVGMGFLLMVAPKPGDASADGA